MQQNLFSCVVLNNNEASQTPSPGTSTKTTPRRPYPKVHVEVPTSSKLPVTDLEGHRHPIILVQRLVEAFSGVSFELDSVCGRGRDPPERGDQDRCCGKSHGGGLFIVPVILSLIKNGTKSLW